MHVRSQDQHKIELICAGRVKTWMIITKDSNEIKVFCDRLILMRYVEGGTTKNYLALPTALIAMPMRRYWWEYMLRQGKRRQTINNELMKVMERSMVEKTTGEGVEVKKSGRGKERKDKKKSKDK